MFLFFFYHHVLEFNGASLLFLLHEILSGVRGAPLGLGQKSALTVHGLSQIIPNNLLKSRTLLKVFTLINFQAEVLMQHQSVYRSQEVGQSP